MKKYIYLFLLTIPSLLLYARNNYEIDARFTFSTDDEVSYTDQYQLKGKLDFTFFIDKNFLCELGLEADKYEIDVEEVLFRYVRNDFDIMFGKYRNKLVLADITSSRDNPLAARSVTENLLRSQSYINRSIGAGIETNNKWKQGYLFTKFSSLEAQFFEPQINAVYMHSFPENIYAGFAGCYFPFFIKDEFLGSSNIISSEIVDGDVENNFTVGLIAYKHKGTFLFGAETIFGKNIHDPIGILYSGLYSSRDFFLGTDIYSGLRLYYARTEIIPAVRTTILFPDTDNMKCNLIEMSLNCKIGFTKNIRLDLAGGTRITTQHDCGMDLVTSLDPLWNISFSAYFR